MSEVMDVMMFESKEIPGVYMPSAPIYDVTLEEADQAVMVIRADRKRPTASDLRKWIQANERHREIMKRKSGGAFQFTIDFQTVFDYYNPVVVSVPVAKVQQALNANRADVE